MSPASYDDIPQRTANMIQLYEDPTLLKATWLSLLAVPGPLVWHRDSGLSSSIWATSVSESCVLGIRCAPRKSSGVHFVELSVDPENLWAQVVVTSYEGWFAQEVELAPLAHAKEMLGVDVSIGFLCIAPPTSLLKFSADLGFSCMTVPVLTRLYTHLRAPHTGPTPTIEYSIAMELEKFVFLALTSRIWS